MFKRIMTPLLLIGLSAALFTGCGQSPETRTAQQTRADRGHCQALCEKDELDCLAGGIDAGMMDTAAAPEVCTSDGDKCYAVCDSL